MDSNIEQIHNELREQRRILERIAKSVDRIERGDTPAEKRSRRERRTLADSLAWNNLLQDLILCGVCLGAVLSVTAIDLFRVNVCPTLWLFYALPGLESVCHENATQTTTQPSVTPTSLDGFTADQMSNAAAIVEVGLQNGASTRDLEIAIATALQESSLQNLSHGDDWWFGGEGLSDSRGLFQQRDSWGSQECRLDPKCAAQLFFDALFQVSNRDSMTLAQAAQSVQNSAFPDEYAKWESDAQTIVAALTSNTKTVASTGVSSAVSTGKTTVLSALIGHWLGEGGAIATAGGDKFAQVKASVFKIDLGNGCGTGFVIENNGNGKAKAVTAAHVVEAAKGNQMTAVLQDGSTANITVLESTPVQQSDVALIELTGDNLPPAAPIDPDGAETGEEIKKFGFRACPQGATDPIEKTGTVTAAAKHVQSRTATVVESSESLVGQGDSGGAIATSEGVVASVSTGETKTGDGGKGWNIAIDVAQDVLDGI